MKITDQIDDLISNSGKNAPQMTHGLKFIGDGNMQKGIEKIKDYYYKEGTKKGTLKGAAGGVSITTIVFALAYYITKKISENKNHEKEGKEILEGLQNGMAEYKTIQQEDIVFQEDDDANDFMKEENNSHSIEES